MKKKSFCVPALLAAALALSAWGFPPPAEKGAPYAAENVCASYAAVGAEEKGTARNTPDRSASAAVGATEDPPSANGPSFALSAAFSVFASADEKSGNAAHPVAAAGQEVKLPVLMYHSVLRSRKGVYVVSPAQLEADLAALRRAGYTPVRAEAVIAYAEGRGELPEKPVLLTFDDGHYNSWYYAAPLLKKYGASAVFNIVGKYADFSTEGERDNPNYSYLTWDELTAMAGSGEAEIGNHTYAMHEMHPRFGAGRAEGESDEEYAAALRADIGKMQSALCGKSGTETAIFAYPFGKYNCVSQKVLREMGFRMILTCNEGVSTIRRGDPSSLFCLCRFNRCGSVSTAHMMREITESRYLPPGE